MSLVTQIPAAQDGLRALVQTALAGVFTSTWTADDVVVGYPAGGPSRPDAVWIHGRVSDRKSVDETTGAGLREKADTFTLHVMLTVVRPTPSYAECRDVAISYMTLIEDAIPENRTLGGAVVDSTVIGGEGPDDALFDNDTGRGVVAQISIECLALTP